MFLGHDIFSLGCIITINQLCYYNPPQHTSHNKTIPYVSHMQSMHYVSTTTIRVTPMESEPMAIVPPPHHIDLEVGWMH